MRIRWTHAAAADLQHINDYLKEHHPQYRHETVRKLYADIGSLKSSPFGDASVAKKEHGKLFISRPCLTWPSTGFLNSTSKSSRIHHAARNRV